MLTSHLEKFRCLNYIYIEIKTEIRGFKTEDIKQIGV